MDEREERGEKGALVSWYTGEDDKGKLGRVALGSTVDTEGK